ncbi:MAG: hypothetical protein V1837_04160 [Candidatus Woesearchaeota archaeon]
MSDLIKAAFSGLYHKELAGYETKLEYGRLKAYNARVRFSRSSLSMQLSSKWKTVSEDIQIGLVQSLLVKVFKKPAKSTNIDLYHHFIKNLGTVVPATRMDPILVDSFFRVNKKYFYGLMEAPNLLFGKGSRRTLGSYNFHTNTISISPILRKVGDDAIDYVMYHELLHKKLQYKANTKSNLYHSRVFKEKEKEFENAEEIERKIRRITRKSIIDFFG